jgi:hypothetical protein
MITMPDNYVVVVPIAIVVEPRANGKAGTEPEAKIGGQTRLHEDH